MKRSHKRSRYLADLRFAVCCAVLALLFLPVQRNVRPRCASGLSPASENGI